MYNLTIKKWESLTLADDFIFCKVFSNEEVCKYLLEQMLGIKISKLTYVESQKTVDLTTLSKGVRFDVYTEVSDNIYDIEMQRVNSIDLPKRARYYQSAIDINTIEKGEHYKKLKESYVIFICMFDPFNQNKSCYHFQNICIDDSNLKLDDKTHKVFYNANSFNKEKNLEVKRFLEYLNNGTTESDFTRKLQELVMQTQHNEKWRQEYMTLDMFRLDAVEEGLQKGLQQGIEKGLQQGIEKGQLEKAIETAKNMKKANIDINTIFECTGLSLEEIEKI